MLVCCYIDDCILIASSEEELFGNVDFALRLFDSLRLTIHTTKSVLMPTQCVEFLGVILDSTNLSLTLPERKIKSIRYLGGGA